jgi:amino acid adenylation domain-containing protein
MSMNDLQGFSLSPQQERLWLLMQAGGGHLYRTDGVFALSGPLDLPALTAALRDVVDRHEILRTVFRCLPGMSVPLQVIAGDGGSPGRLVPPAAPGAGTADLLAAARRAPFDLEAGPTFRATVVSLGAERHGLVVSLPALNGDAASLGVLLRDLAACYGHRRGGPPPQDEPLQYADLAGWQRDLLEAGGGGIDWQRLLPAVEAPRLPWEKDGPFEPRIEPVTLDAETHRVGEVARSLGASPRVLLLAGWQVFLARLTGRPDLVVGIGLDGRRYEGLDQALGTFARYLPIQARLAGKRFDELLRETGAAVAEASEEQELFSWQSAGRESGAFPFLCDLLEAPAPVAAGGLEIRLAEQRSCLERFHLRLAGLMAGGELRLELHYDAGRISRHDAARWAAGLAALLQRIVGEPRTSTGELEILGEAERHALLIESNDTAADLPAEVCVHGRFETWAARSPERIAASLGGQTLPYGALNRRANRLARHLVRQGVGPGALVGICLERSLDLLVAVLGVLKAGGAYLPLDPSYPADRLAYMISDAGAPVLLTQRSLRELLPDTSARAVCLDAEGALWAGEDGADLEHRAGPEDLAYVIYTSGSTGRPKGVMIPHRGLANYLGWCSDVYDLGGGKGAPVHSPIGFDLTVTSLLSPLVAGRTVFLVPDERGVGGLVDLLAGEGGFSLVKITPAHLEILGPQLSAADLAACARVVVVGGEALRAEGLAVWRAGAPGARIINEYGPTEAVVGCCVYEVPPDAPAAGPVPIGRPVPNARLYLLDAHLRPVPLGAEGELCIAGVALARGYLGRPDLTAERFLPDPAGPEAGGRMYRTGDLARWRPDGQLEFLGRIDHQVKIRGFRIELGEIEAALSAYPDVREAVVLAREDRPGDRRLVAYLLPEGDAALSGEDLRAFAARSLPEHMVPAFFETVAAWPLTPNGKVDRRALPAPGERQARRAGSFVAPRNLVEEVLAAIWAEVLGVDPVGVTDNFFQLGGDSILSITVLAKARERGFSLSPQDFFRVPTLGDMARELLAAREPELAFAPVPPFSLLSPADRERLPEEAEDAYPLTRLQAGMLFHSAHNLETAVYHDISSFHLRGPLDPRTLRAVIEQLVQRHPALRTSFHATGFSEPLQIVHRAARPSFRVEELRHLSAVEQEEELASWREREKRLPFDWAKPPLVRFQVHVRGADSFQFTLSYHHAIVDGWSVASLLAELFQHYSSLLRGEVHSPAPLPEVAYRDFVALERRALESFGQRELWRERLADCSFLALPRLGEPVPGAPPAIRPYEVPLAPDLGEPLRRLAAAEGVPVKSLALAAHLKVLSVLGGQEDVLTGLVSHGRPEVAGSERIAGLFLNTLPFRLDVAGGSWRDLVRRAFEVERDLLPFRRYPLAEIQRLQGGKPLFETLFNFVHFHVYKGIPSFGEIQPVDADFFEETNFTFTASFSVSGSDAGLRLRLDYDANELGAAQIQEIGGYYAAALAAMAASPEARHGGLSLLSGSERRRSEAWAGIPADLPSALLHEVFAEHARLRPQAPALLFAGGALTYAELERRASLWARRLRALGVGPDRVVGVFAERSPEAVIALLAILKAGGAYLPLDPSYPAARLAFVIENSGLTVALTQSHLAGEIPGSIANVLVVDASAEPAAGEDGEPPAAVPPDTLAYVIYTSGSTGLPKGVALPHRGLANLIVQQARGFGVEADSRVLQYASPSFDAAISEIGMAFLAGAALCLPASREEVLPGPGLLRLLREAGITHVTLPPSVLAALPPEELPALRTLIAAGEACSAEIVRRWAPGRRFLNAYGPTEVTVCATFGEVPATTARPTIGRPLRNARVHVLDRDLQSVPVGVAGELFVAGVGLARGYLGRPDLTAARFLPSPFGETPGARLYATGDLARFRADGELEFLGRIDQQVKIRGFRVEPGEIEASLLEHPGVREAAVVPREDEPGERRLVAYVVPERRGEAPGVEEVRSFLRERLPEHLLPGALVTLDALPLTPDGKLDRRALPAPRGMRTALRVGYVAPRTEVERALAAVWREVLRVEQVGLDDNFFDLGGHSLHLLQIQGRIRESLGLEVSILDLLTHSTVSALATHLAPARSGAHLERRPGPAVPAAQSGVAVVALAGRFPGAEDVEALWRNLIAGVESLSSFTEEELLREGIPAETVKDPAYVRSKGVLDGVEGFDAAFFGVTPREAELTDPQQRIFLECAWEALERAGYLSDRETGPVGVFAGESMNSYLFNLLSNPDLVESVGAFQTVTVNDKDFLATRVSYKLNLEGPGVTVQTACSTSLVAVHLACQSLLNGECEIALAGGVSVRVPQRSGYLYQVGGIDSPDGHCRAFDAEAGGTVAGNGVGIVVLKRLDRALADRDRVLAVIKGSAINNDGSHKAGYTAPRIEGQARVIRAAHRSAGVEAGSISYVEAHGTGTPLGDPIEVAALTEAFRASSDRRGFCALGSVKTNIGHLDAAAGVAGLIKAVLALQHETIPPSLHFKRPNPRIDFESSPFYVNDRAVEWRRGESPRRAGVSSFGIGGTNVHVVLEEAPLQDPAPAETGPQALLLSARTGTALDQATERLAHHLERHPDLALADVAYTLQVGRRGFHHRRTLVCRTVSEAVQILRTRDERRLSSAQEEARWRPVAFLFPGQGAQHVDMAAGVYRSRPELRRQVGDCAEILRPCLGFDLREVLYPGPEGAGRAAERLAETALTQPALFTIEYALARLWMSWGVEPEAMLGHSIGEYVAACLAGVMSLEEALPLVAARGQLIQALPGGAMLTVPLSEEEARATAPGLEVAATSSPDLTVLSGPVDAVAAVEAELGARGLHCRRLHTSHAFHSALIDPALEAFGERVARVTLRPPSIPFVSNVTGTWIEPAEAASPGYWVRHLRSAVRFSEGVATLLQEPDRLLLEVGPGTTLATLARRHPGRSSRQVVLSSLPHPQESAPADESLLAAAGRLWLAGFPVDWQALHEGRWRVPLPTYPFERQRFWVEARPREAVPAASPRSTTREPVERWLYLPSWKRSGPTVPDLPETGAPSLWVLFAAEGALGDRLGDRLKLIGRKVVRVRAGRRLELTGEDVYTVDAASPASYRELCRALAERAGRLHFVHLWSLEPEPGETFEAEQERGFLSLIFLARALSTGGPAEISVVTRGVLDVTGDEELCPARATLIGPAKVIPQELPHLSCRVIDVAVPPAGGPAEDRALGLLADELLSGPPEPLIAHRGSSRWLQVFEPAPWRLDEGPSPRRHGVYVILGGLGRLGLELASHLARTRQARLVLTRRSPFPARGDWESWLAHHGEEDAVAQTLLKIRELEVAGAEVWTASLDAADEPALRALLAETEARWGGLHGVIHAAGVVGEPGLQPIEEIDAERAELHFRPKVRGVLALARALEGRDLDFCLLFSSLASLLGGLGFSAYAGASAFLDAFANRRGRQERTLWRSVDWDAWDLPGPAGSPGITAAEADAAFRAVLSFPRAGQLVVSTADLEERRRRWSYPAATSAPAAAAAEREPALHDRPGLSVSYVPPRTDLERRIAAIWQGLLGIREVGVLDNFFELGGHSLLATQLAAQLREALQVAVSLRTVFDAPTVAGLSEALRGDTALARPLPPPITPVPRDGETPLSFAQQRLWFLSRLEPESPYYNLHAALLLNGDLDAAALERSLGEVVRRHEILRTRFGGDAERPVQIVVPGLRLPLAWIDLTALPPELRQAEQHRLSPAEARRPFDLAWPPLLRVALLRLGAGAHLLLLTIHHIVWDAWSFSIFIQEVSACYEAFARGGLPALAGLPVQYADFASWQRAWMQGEVLGAELDHWRRQLAGAPPVLDLPFARPRPPVQTFRGARLPVELPGDLSEAARALCLREDVTLFMLLLAVFSALLRYYTRRDDVVVGTDSAGRDRGEVAGLIGFFVNQLVLRTDLSGDPSFVELLARVRAVTLEAYEHQDLPFDRLLAALNPERNPSYAPLFQIKLVLQNTPRASLGLHGLSLTLLEAEAESAQLDLILNLSETPEGIAGSFEYNTDLFNPAAIQRMAGQLERLLRLAAEQPEARLSALDARLAEGDLQSARSASHEGLRRARRREVNAPV